MIRSTKVAAVLGALGLALAVSQAQAQSPYGGYRVMPASVPEPVAIPSAAPIVPPTALPPAAPVVSEGCGGGCCATHKVCVVEPKEKTKVLYCTREKEFCIKSCGLFSHGDCGCCQLRCKKVLIKKIVPDCPGTTCVLKEVPVEAAPCCSQH
jgi:hypothetical protein